LLAAFLTSWNMKPAGAFRALRHRNFKLFFYGQMLSMSGTWVQRIAQGWLAYRLTGSPLLLGYVTFAGSASAIFLSPLAGVIADRVNRHRMLIIAQVLEMVQSALLAVVTLEGAITPGRLVLFAFFLGTVTAFENPARQAFFVQMVSTEDLPSAIALNASLVNAARVVGPAAAGLLVAAYGEGICFLVNSLSFVAVLIALLLMKLEDRREDVSPGSGFELLRQGFTYIRWNRRARSLLTVFAILNFAGTPYLTLLPIFAGNILHVGASGLGWLVTASGAGAIVMAVGMVFRTDTSRLLQGVRIAGLVFAAALVLLGLSRSFPLSMLTMLLIGGGYVVTLAGTQTLLQVWVSDSLRGRVMSFYSLVFLGIPPFGSLFAGWLAGRIGAPLTVSCGGLVCLLATFAYSAKGERDATDAQGFGQDAAKAG
jgi:MFS family permease